MEEIRGPAVSNFVVESEEDGEQQAELDEVEHKNVEQTTVVDVLGQLVCLEQVQAYLPNHVHYLYYLVPLTPQLNIRLLSYLLRVYPHPHCIHYQLVLLLYLLLTLLKSPCLHNFCIRILQRLIILIESSVNILSDAEVTGSRTARSGSAFD